MNMSKSTYYFEINRKDVVLEKNKNLARIIEEIFVENKKRYGVRRVYIFLAFSLMII